MKSWNLSWGNLKNSNECSFGNPIKNPRKFQYHLSWGNLKNSNECSFGNPIKNPRKFQYHMKLFPILDFLNFLKKRSFFHRGQSYLYSM
jgi:hypothetical protein